MKKNLTEELKRIHSLTYGKEILNEEGFLNKILKSVGLEKQDDPKKADEVSQDVDAFFKTLENSVNSGGLSQQSSGNIQYQKEVESLQIGLILLGYELPRYGVDGKFGSETASAVKKFTEEKVTKENISEAALTSPIGDTSVNSKFGPRWGRMHAGVDLKAKSGTPIKSPLDGEVIDAKITSNACGGTLFIKHADGYKTRYCHCKQLNVKVGDFVKKGDIVGLTGGAAGDVGRGRSDGAHLHFEVYKDGKLVNPMDHLGSEVGEYVSGGSSGEIVKATPEMITKMIELLKERGVTSEDLKKHIDSVLTGGAGFTDIDLSTDEGRRQYTEICQRYINTRSSNLLGITGEMLTKGAVMAFENYNKFVPAELALAQLAVEGGFSKNPDARPIKTKNPFNVGNTDSGKNIFESNVQDGINRYYSLIARNYLGGGKTASDLVKNFVNKNGNRYASGQDYENQVGQIASQVNKISQSVVSA
jgi:murein DD-endopeptidase MepM/ murein hydrolase activator NlpD